ncbi:ABC transporter substrate-binding protein [Advenella faeciporci]|uniref:ABC transporter substrate-binding protein n=1 Tax=Advenella faeciporci TaxID=797535 RepID=A0A918MZL5_9BURK|nr:tripartite tricarboxylate transporter substrate binding protein [Advenella faeciporci]GGW85692.1 ABC transporter substrate-binding protein [Advenella faeciporci]
MSNSIHFSRSRLRALFRGICASTALLLAQPAQFAVAQEYPQKTIKWIVPYGPGGASDILARILGEHIGAELKQQIIIENRPGAGGTIGTAALAKAPADGYTLATADNSTLFNNWHLFSNLSYKQQDFDYVATTAQLPLLLVVNANTSVKNYQEWLGWIKQSSEKISYASPGIGSPHHIAMETLSDRENIHMVHVPYRGDAAAIVDIVGGQIQTALVGVANARPYQDDPRVRFLAVTGSSRLSSMPDVPTFAELGLKDFQGSAEQGIIMPAGVPQDIINRWNKEVAKALEIPAIRERLETLGMYPVISSPDEFKSYVNDRAKQAGEIIKKSGITIN